MATFTMKFFMPLASLLAVMTPTLSRVIIGGHESTPNSRPYQVALYGSRSASWQFCGGTLVHKRWVVSAGHCKSGRYVFVGLGLHDKYNHSAAGQQIIKGKWHRHRGYSGGTLDNDISLIELSKDADIGNGKIEAIDITNKRPAKGTNLLVSGWGTTSSGGSSSRVLMEVMVNATSMLACRKAYGSPSITDNMFCAAASGKDFCQGDEGGPIVSGYGDGTHDPGTTLEGIVSWGYGCAHAKYPGVFTTVGNYCDWIAETSGDAVKCSS
ncbi:trypsin-2-like [Acanthaster planci]|uniref:Trypsin-2-like n=1 Tax=Acanthaster planci TaxID=133434 RepID=A0A8B7YET4_ACAPL|nr:trypsin-2-like [Acanthaster planci]